MPTSFPFSHFQLLTGSGEVLVYYMRQWCDHFKSRRAGDKLPSATMHKVHLCVPVGAFTFLGPFTPVFYIFHYHMGPFYPREPPPLSG